jgi:acetyl-CoA C-acetyltransferase
VADDERAAAETIAAAPCHEVSRTMTEALIIDAVRTPRGKGRPTGALHDVHPQELLAQLLRALPERTSFDPADVEDVVMGNGVLTGDHGDNIARMATLLAGYPLTVPGLVLHRFCGSGQNAVTVAAMGIVSGMQDLVVAGGVDSMSRWGRSVGAATIDGDNPALRALYPSVPQGISADLIATIEGFSRTDVDAFAAESQRRAEVAAAEGRFDRSLIAVTDADGNVVLAADEHPRPGTTVETLAGLKPAFEAQGAESHTGEQESFDELCLRVYPQVDHIEHVHHAGNSSGVVDGAGAVLVASDRWVAANGATPRARIKATAAIGSEPVIMLTAPAPAAERALAKAGMTVADIDLWEINEAFASVPMKAMRDLGIDHDRVNVNGGAIALGHPIGATGSMLIGTLLDELERRDLSTGLVTMCTGGGMGTATIIERV